MGSASQPLRSIVPFQPGRLPPPRLRTRCRLARSASFGGQWGSGEHPRAYMSLPMPTYISIGGALSMTCVRRQARCGSRPRPPNAGNVVARTIACAPRAAPLLAQCRLHHRSRIASDTRLPCTTARAAARTASPALPVNGRVTVGRFSRRIPLSPLPSEPQAPTISMRIRQGQTQHIVYNPRKGCR